MPVMQMSLTGRVATSWSFLTSLPRFLDLPGSATTRGRHGRILFCLSYDALEAGSAAVPAITIALQSRHILLPRDSAARHPAPPAAHDRPLGLPDRAHRIIVPRDAVTSPHARRVHGQRWTCTLGDAYFPLIRQVWIPRGSKPNLTT